MLLLRRITLASAIALLGLAPPAPHALAATDAQPNRIRVEYIEPKSPDHQAIYQIIKDRRVLEKLQEIFGAFRLPIELTLRSVECDGVANAWYQRGRVSVCYEYLQEIMKMMPREDNAAGVAPADAVAGQFFYVLAHEMGHAMFDLLDVPVLGRPEDAADQFATYIILQFGKEQARRLILGAAYSYRRFVANPKVTAPLKAFSDAHSPPATRFYNIVCLAYGADSTLFADFVTKEYLPTERANGCRKEYGEVAFAFSKLIVPHLDKEIAKKVLQTDWLPEVKMKSTPN